MISLCSPVQTRRWDAYTMAEKPISDFALMEQAARAFAEAFRRRYSPEVAVYVLAGKGNNGGDGLCVARFLREKGYAVEVLLFLGGGSSLSCRQALQGWQQMGGVLTSLERPEQLMEMDLWRAQQGVWIDALLGTGLSRPLEGAIAALVEQLNRMPLACVALDTPSGLRLDAPQQGPSVRATHTISLQVPKRAFFLPENTAYVGSWETVDIGLMADFWQNEQPEHGYLAEAADVGAWLPLRPRHLHKGQAGRGLLVAGSRGMFGAAVLAARAALRGGAGVVHVHVPRDGVALLHAALPEALLQPDPHPSYVTAVASPERATAVAVGPGLGQQLPTAAVLRRLFRTELPFVVDADALNLVSAHPELRAELPVGSLLTPHEGELARLTGSWTDDYDKLRRLQALAEESASTVLLKGAYTVIASPGAPLHFNSTGNAGMATAGSGDVLTGLLLALLAAGLTPARAALVGAFLHGRAGDLAAVQKGSHGLIAGDIVEQLPAAFLSVNQS